MPYYYVTNDTDQIIEVSYDRLSPDKVREIAQQLADELQCEIYVLAGQTAAITVAPATE